MKYLKIENRVLVWLSVLIAIFFIIIYVLHIYNGYYQWKFKLYEELIFKITFVGILYLILSIIFFTFYFLIKRISTKNTIYNLPLKKYSVLIIYGVFTIFIFGIWAIGASDVEGDNFLVYDNMEFILVFVLALIQYVVFRLIILSPLINQKHITKPKLH